MHLKDKKGCILKILMHFKKFWVNQIVNQNKIWTDKGSAFYNRLMKSFLQNNDIKIYSMHDEGKSVKIY